MRDSLLRPCALSLSVMMMFRAIPAVAFQAPVNVSAKAILTCEQLADSPEDPNRTTPGVPRNRINVEPAIAACEKAVRENPQSLIAAYDYSRVLAVSGRIAESEDLNLRGAQRGYGPSATDYGVSLASHPNPNYILIKKYFEQGGSAGHMLGWYNLGRLYINGLGVEKDIPKGVNLVRTAADGGSITAARELGAIFLDGKLTARDNVAAVKWLSLAAQRDDAAANYLRGLMTETGNGVEKNVTLSVAYVQRAAFLGSGAAISHLADMSLIGNPNDVAVQAKAREQYLEAANLGDDWGIRRTIEFDLNGVGGARLPVQAVKFLQPLAARNDPWALTVLGGCYRRGDGVPFDETKAMQLFVKAGNLGDAEAASEVGRGLMNGFGNDPKDFVTAAKWFSIASEKHYGPAEVQLGYLYQKGWGVPQDRSQAYDLYNLALSNGDEQVRKVARQLLSELGTENPNASPHKELSPGELLVAGAAALFIIGVLSPSSSSGESKSAQSDDYHYGDYMEDFWDRQREIGLGQAYCKSGAGIAAATLGVMCY